MRGFSTIWNRATGWAIFHAERKIREDMKPLTDQMTEWNKAPMVELVGRKWVSNIDVLKNDNGDLRLNITLGLFSRDETRASREFIYNPKTFLSNRAIDKVTVHQKSYRIEATVLGDGSIIYKGKIPGEEKKSYVATRNLNEIHEAFLKDVVPNIKAATHVTPLRSQEVLYNPVADGVYGVGISSPALRA